MRLTVLGGAAASPNAGQGCAGFLIEAGETRIVLDLGPGTLPELRKHADFRTLDAVVISHMHLDHVLDLLALRHALAYNPIRPPRPTPVWLPPSGADLLSRVVAPFDACDDPGTFVRTIEVSEHDPNVVLRVEEIDIMFYEGVHDIRSWSIRVAAAGGGSLGHTADTAPHERLSSFFGGVDLLIAEATLTSADRALRPDARSMSAEEAGRLATDGGASAPADPHLAGEGPRRSRTRSLRGLQRANRRRLRWFVTRHRRNGLSHRCTGINSPLANDAARRGPQRQCRSANASSTSNLPLLQGRWR